MKQNEWGHSGTNENKILSRSTDLFCDKNWQEGSILMYCPLPLKFVLAELVKYVGWWVVWKVVHSIHGFVHSGDIFNCSLLFMLVMIHDVVHTTQTYRENIKQTVTTYIKNTL